MPSFPGTAERYVNKKGGKVRVFEAYLFHHPRYRSPLILIHHWMTLPQGRQP